METGTMRASLILTLAVLLVCLTGGCSPDSPSAQTRTVRVGVLRIDDSIPLFLAERDGLFAQHGVEAELVEFGSASDQMKAAEAGEIDLMMTDMVVTSLLKKGGADFKVVAMALGAGADEGRFLVLSSPGSDILNPEDLYGATVAISENTMMDYLLERYENVLGLDSTAIRKLHIPSLSLRLDALMEGGEVQAAILPDPLAALAASMGANVVIDDTALGLNLSQSVYVVPNHLLDEDHTLVEKALAAVWQAMDLLNSTPEEYREYCMVTANVPVAVAGAYSVPTYTPRALPGSDDVAAIMDWLVSRGLLVAPWRYDALVDSSIAGPAS